MSALAQYFLQRGDRVSGYDLTPSAVTEMLQRKGADIHFEGDIAKIPAEVDFVVYTPAVPKDFVEYQYLVGTGVPMYKRSQVLGHITDELKNYLFDYAMLSEPPKQEKKKAKEPKQKKKKMNEDKKKKMKEEGEKMKEGEKRKKKEEKEMRKKEKEDKLKMKREEEDMPKKRKEEEDKMKKMKEEEKKKPKKENVEKWKELR